MNLRKFFSAAAVSMMMVAMSSSAFAKGSDPMQQQQQQQQQMPPKMEQHKQAPPVKQHKARFIRVHRGDTLSRIAHRYHTSVAHLKKLNHLRGSRILVGQRLRVS